jgi:hypothetical protein
LVSISFCGTVCVGVGVSVIEGVGVSDGVIEGIGGVDVSDGVIEGIGGVIEGVGVSDGVIEGVGVVLGGKR